MGRSNNARARQRAAEENSRPARARFSNWKPPSKKGGGRGGRGRGGRGRDGDREGGGRGGRGARGRNFVPESTVQKVTAAAERKRQTVHITKPGGNRKSGVSAALRGIDLDGLEAVVLAEEQIATLDALLKDLNVIDGDVGGSLNAQAASWTPPGASAARGEGREADAPPRHAEATEASPSAPGAEAGKKAFDVRCEEVRELGRVIEGALDVGDAPLALSAVDTLDGLEVDIPLLQRTMIARAVSKAKQSGDDVLAAAAKALSKKWKRLVREQVEADETAADAEEAEEAADAIAQSPVYRYLTARFSFSDAWARRAIEATAADSLNEVLDWLCLHLGERELQKGFQPFRDASAAADRGGGAKQGRFDVKRPSSGNVRIHRKSDWAFDARVLYYCRLGFSRPDVERAIARRKGTDVDALPPPERDFPVLLPLLDSFRILDSTENPPPAAALAAARAEELEALEAIFEERLSIDAGDPMVITVELQDVFLSPAAPKTSLDFVFPSGSLYPAEAPHALLRNESLPPSVTREAMRGLRRRAEEEALERRPCVFELISWLQGSANELQDAFFRGTPAPPPPRERSASSPRPEKPALATPGGPVATKAAAVEDAGARKASVPTMGSRAKAIERTMQKEMELRKERERREQHDRFRARFVLLMSNGMDPKEAKRQAREDVGLPAEDDSVGTGDGPASGAAKESTARKPRKQIIRDAAVQILCTRLGCPSTVARSLILQAEERLNETGKRGKNRRRQLRLRQGRTGGNDSLLLTEDDLVDDALYIREKQLRQVEGTADEVEPPEATSGAPGTGSDDTSAGVRGRGNTEDRLASVAPAGVQILDKRGVSVEEDFTPSPYLTDILNGIEDTSARQPWLLKKAGADARSAPHDGKRRRVSQRLQDDMSRKRTTEKYQAMLETRSKLPAFQLREHIVETIANNQVVIISGATGCGKTTQVPQLVLDQMIDDGNGADANMVVTQPRRISAIGVAERIAAERCERVGETSGYSIRLESKRSNRTRLLLCTTGILLRRMQVDSDLSTISHVFVDEVHERDLNTDFLLIILRRLLRRRSDIKLVLMSATMNAEVFAAYFDGAPIVSIAGRAFPVTPFFLEDCLLMTGHRIQAHSEFAVDHNGKSKGRKKMQGQGPDILIDRTARGVKRDFPRVHDEDVLESLRIADEDAINYPLVAAVVSHICKHKGDGAVLIFMPGLAEIQECITELEAVDLGPSRILPLHSSLSTQEQSAVFVVPPPGVRKVVVSTNIAETSITIEDVVFVVDGGRVKENQYDSMNQMPMLCLTWASQAAATQRRGRAGRVQPGECYHICSSRVWRQLQEFSLPEILRVPLDELVLQVLLLDLGDPRDFLAQAVTPPAPEAVHVCLSYLQELSAVELSALANDESASIGLTTLGFHLAALPVAPRIGKCMLVACIFSCLDPVCTIAACMSERNPFVAPLDKREQADEARRAFGVLNSDHLTMLKAYNEWKQAKRGGFRAERDFCRAHFLSRLTLQRIDDLRSQFLEMLAEIGFTPRDRRACQALNHNSDKENVVLACITAGLYPNVLEAPRSGTAGAKKIGEVAMASIKGPMYVFPSTMAFQSSVASLSSRYMVYHERVKTSKVYVRDASPANPVALMLFGGKLDVHHRERVICLDSWLHFRFTDMRSATLVKYVRQQLEDVLLQKITQPNSEVTELGARLIAAVSALLQSPRGPGRAGGAADGTRPPQETSRGVLGRGREARGQDGSV